jgi:hypothetical protein
MRNLSPLELEAAKARRPLTVAAIYTRFESDDAICFPLLNDRNQSAADHQGSTAAGPRKWTFPCILGRSNIVLEADVR